MVARIIEVTRRGRQGEQGNPGSTAFEAVTTAGSSTVYTLTNGTPIVTYADGYGVTIDANATNGAAPTMNVDGLGAVPIKKLSGGSSVAIVAGDMVADNFYMIHYSAVESAFILFGGVNVDYTNPQLGGPLDANSHQINESKGADVASDSALTLGADGNYFDITGTTAITSIGTLGVGTEVTLHFDGILNLTHNATDLILPGAADITTAAGDEAIFREYATGDWRCISYSPASGQSVAGLIESFQSKVVLSSQTDVDFALVSGVDEHIFTFKSVRGSGGTPLDMYVECSDDDKSTFENIKSEGILSGTPTTYSQAEMPLASAIGPGHAVQGQLVLSQLSGQEANLRCATAYEGASTGKAFISGGGVETTTALTDVRFSMIGASNDFTAGEIIYTTKTYA